MENKWMIKLPNMRNAIKGFSLPCLFFALYAIYGNILAFNNELYSTTYQFICSIIIYMCIPMGLYLLFFKQNLKIKINNLILLILPGTYLLIQIVHTYNGYKGEWLTAFAVISLFCLLSDLNKVTIFEYFYRIILITNMIALIIYLMNVIEPNMFEKVPYYTENAAYYNFYYTKCGIFAIYGNRLCSIFNEPGGLGTVCAFLFIITFRKSTKLEKANLLITGFLTYSLAFFMLIYVFLLLYLFQKNIKYFWIAALLGVFFLIIPYIDFHNDVINLFTARMKIVDGNLAGNNRTTSTFDYLYNNFKNTDDIYWGRGVGYVLDSHSASYKNYIVQMGILGTGIWLVEWVICVAIKAGKGTYQYMIFVIFLLSVYQRPNIPLTLVGYVLIFAGFAWQYYENGDINE